MIERLQIIVKTTNQYVLQVFSCKQKTPQKTETLHFNNRMGVLQTDAYENGAWGKFIYSLVFGCFFSSVNILQPEPDKLGK